MAHADERLQERAPSVSTKILDDIRGRLYGVKLPSGAAHHVPLFNDVGVLKGYAVVKPVGKNGKPVVASVLSPEMSPPGMKLDLEKAAQAWAKEIPGSLLEGLGILRNVLKRNPEAFSMMRRQMKSLSPSELVRNSRPAAIRPSLPGIKMGALDFPTLAPYGVGGAVAGGVGGAALGAGAAGLVGLLKRDPRMMSEFFKKWGPRAALFGAGAGIPTGAGIGVYQGARDQNPVETWFLENALPWAAENIGPK